MDQKLGEKFQRLENKISCKFVTLQDDVKTVREDVADSKVNFKELDTKESDIKSAEFSIKVCEEKTNHILMH